MHRSQMGWGLRLSGLLAVSLIAALAAPVAAQQDLSRDRTGDMSAQSRMDMGTGRMLKASDLLGMSVVNPQGDELGTIDNIVLTPTLDRVSYVVLEHGGTLGMGADYFAIPWQAVHIRQRDGEQQMVLNITTDQLEQAEGFDPDNWPNRGDPRWLSPADRQRMQQQIRQRVQQQGMYRQPSGAQQGQMGTGQELQGQWRTGQDAYGYEDSWQQNQAQPGQPQQRQQWQQNQGQPGQWQQRPPQRDQWQQNQRQQDQWQDDSWQQQGYQGDSGTSGSSGQQSYQSNSGQFSRQPIQGRQPQFSQPDFSRREYQFESQEFGYDDDQWYQDQDWSGDQGYYRDSRQDSWQQDNWQQPSRQGRGATMRQPVSAEQFDFRKADHLIGLSVSDYDDQNLGDIEDLIIDANSGRIAYGVVSFGGMLGMGEEVAAVPWNALNISPDDDLAMLDATQSDLEAVSAASVDELDFQSSSFAQRMHQHFGVEPAQPVYGFEGQQDWQQQPQRQQDWQQQQDWQRQQGTQQDWQMQGGQGSAGTQSFDIWQANSPYNRMFNPERTSTVRGTIQSVGTFRPDHGADGLRLRLQTQQGNMVTVHAGPAIYARQQKISFRQGDSVTVTGSPLRFNGRTVMMASQVRSGDKTLNLRDEQGRPQWNIQELQRFGSQSGQQSGQMNQDR